MSQSAAKKARQAERARSAMVARDKEEMLKLRYWVTAYLDMMGYKSLLAAMDHPTPPIPDPGTPEYARLHDATIRAIVVRQTTVDSFETIIKILAPKEGTPANPKLRAEVRDQVRGWRNVGVTTAHFSDSFMFYLCLNPPSPGSAAPFQNLVTMLLGCSLMMLSQLAGGYPNYLLTLPLRGAISIGTGIQAPDRRSAVDGKHPFLSPAMVRAYTLEQDGGADYPRVLLSDEFMGFVDSVNITPGESFDERANRNLIEAAKRFMFTDHDGKMALDFLGPGLRQMERVAAKARLLIPDAWRFTQKALEVYRAQPNPTLVRKYQWLSDYIRDRLPDWGLKP